MTIRIDQPILVGHINQLNFISKCFKFLTTSLGNSAWSSVSVVQIRNNRPWVDSLSHIVTLCFKLCFVLINAPFDRTRNTAVMFGLIILSHLYVLGKIHALVFRAICPIFAALLKTYIHCFNVLPVWICFTAITLKGVHLNLPNRFSFPIFVDQS